MYSVQIKYLSKRKTTEVYREKISSLDNSVQNEIYCVLSAEFLSFLIIDPIILGYTCNYSEVVNYQTRSVKEYQVFNSLYTKCSQCIPLGGVGTCNLS